MSESASQERDTFEIEGLDAFSARKGTATHVLAGAAKYWQNKYYNLETQVTTARRTGFLGGSVFASLAILVSYAVYHVLSH